MEEGFFCSHFFQERMNNFCRPFHNYEIYSNSERPVIFRLRNANQTRVLCLLIRKISKEVLLVLRQ